MKSLKEYILETQNIAEISDTFKNKMGGTSGVLCKIHEWIDRFKKNAPIVGGNWNPREYVSEFKMNKFLDWVKEEWPAALQEDHEDELWVMEGTTYEHDINKEDRETVDVYEVLKEVTKLLGKPTGGGGVRASCFGKIGIGSKFKYAYYFGKGQGGLLLQGGHLPSVSQDNIGNRVINWVLLLDADTFNRLGFAVDDKIQSIEEQTNITLNGKIK